MDPLMNIKNEKKPRKNNFINKGRERDNLRITESFEG